MTIEQTVKIPDNHRLHLDFNLRKQSEARQGYLFVSPLRKTSPQNGNGFRPAPGVRLNAALRYAMRNRQPE
jgi:hypothetical protein